MKKHKENKASRILLFISTLTGIVFSIYLVVSEIFSPGFCPLLFNIPACYLVLASFVLVFISLFINNAAVRFLIFYIGTLSGLGIAIWFSIGQILGLRQCPDLLNIPLCFGSGILFILIIVFGSIKTRK
jgi:hypothetical protein